MNAQIQRLRAEVASDLQAFTQRFGELESLQLISGAPLNENAIHAQVAVALHHGYSAVEAALARVTKALEGDVPQGRDWHQGLLANATLEIESVRPRLISGTTAKLLHELLAFRYFFRHAYGVPLEGTRLEALRKTYLEVHPLVIADFRVLDQLLLGLAQSIV